MHVSHAAVSHMLVNSESLRGIAPRVRALAAREAAVSAVVPPHVSGTVAVLLICLLHCLM